MAQSLPTGAALAAILLLAACTAGDPADPASHAAAAAAATTEPTPPPADLELADGQAQARLAVSGMHCQGCVRGVTAELSAVTGVARCVVDLDHGQALVAYDPDRASVDDLTKAVAASGKQATPIDE